MTGWSKLDDKIHRPDTKGVAYRETHCTVFADNKLWFFGCRGVDALPNDSMSWHESCMLDGFVSIFDVNTKKWEFKEYPKLDDTHSHRGRIFVVKDKVLMIVYGIKDSYWKLFVWDNDKWTDVKFEDQCTKVCFPTGCNAHISSTEDGLYFVDSDTCICKLSITVEGGHVKGAKFTEATGKCCDAKASGEVEFKLIAYDSKKLAQTAVGKNKIALWYGENTCGFWWRPEHPSVGDIKPDGTIHLEKLDVAEPRPPYAYGGPSRIVVAGNNAVMLGGSSQAGLGHVKDQPEIWIYDMAANVYKKASAEMPENVPNWRLSTAFDSNTGNVYLCDLLTGIYTMNVKGL